MGPCVQGAEIKGGSQCDIVEKIALDPNCCIADTTTTVDTSLLGGTWGGTMCAGC